MRIVQKRFTVVYLMVSFQIAISFVLSTIKRPVEFIDFEWALALLIRTLLSSFATSPLMGSLH